MVLWPAASVTWEMAWHTESDTRGVGPSSLFEQVPQEILRHAQVGDPKSQEPSITQPVNSTRPTIYYKRSLDTLFRVKTDIR